MQQLVTGEAVALDLRPAALPSRLLAGTLDAFLQLLLFFGLAALESAVAPSVSSAAESALTIVLIVAVGIGYPVTFETLLRGRTPGKAALGLRVVRDDGGPIGFRQSFVRGLAALFLERPGITLFTGAILTMLLNSRGKRIGDLLAGTVVLRERVSVRGGQVAMMPPELAGWAATTDLSGLSNELALSVRQFLARADELTAPAREELGGRLLTAVVDVVTPMPPVGAPGRAVLAAVLAERRRREETRLSTAVAPSAWGPTPSYGPAPDVPPATVVPPMTPSPPAVDAPPAAGPGGFVAPS